MRDFIILLHNRDYMSGSYCARERYEKFWLLKWRERQTGSHDDVRIQHISS